MDPTIGIFYTDFLMFFLITLRLCFFQDVGKYPQTPESTKNHVISFLRNSMQENSIHRQTNEELYEKIVSLATLSHAITGSIESPLQLFFQVYYNIYVLLKSVFTEIRVRT